MKTAVLVIDVQQGLCHGADGARDMDAVFVAINRVTGKARAANMPVIFIQHEQADGLLARGSEGWQLANELQRNAGDVVMAKTATDSFHRTPLEQILRERGVTELVICGLQSQFCVDTTTRRAMALGFPVRLVADGHSTTDSATLSAAQIRDHHNETLSNISSFGPRTRALPSREIAFD